MEPHPDNALAASIRQQIAEEIARAIEVAFGDRCPECGGKPASSKWMNTEARWSRLADAEPDIGRRSAVMRGSTLLKLPGITRPDED